jgi:hypothetical protein
VQPEHGTGLVSVYNVLADFHDEDKFSYSRIGEGSVEKTNPKGRERIRSSFFTKLLEEKQFVEVDHCYLEASEGRLYSLGLNAPAATLENIDPVICRQQAGPICKLNATASWIDRSTFFLQR